MDITWRVGFGVSGWNDLAKEGALVNEGGHVTDRGFGSPVVGLPVNEM